MNKFKKILIAGTVCLSVSVLSLGLSPFSVYAEVAPSVATQGQVQLRRLPVDGSNNLRDIGGYKTEDGRTVKMGVIYRSAAMNRISEAGFADLKKLGIKTNIDFRSTEERASAPVNWPEDMKVNVFTVDYSIDNSAFMAVFSDKTITGEKTAQIMEQFYRQAPFQFAPQYKTLVHELIANHTPLVYNCSAGKDRTGVATAILLTILGVPRETIIEDYLLSNQYYVPDMPREGEKQDPALAFFKTLPPEVVQALMGVDRRYLSAAFEAIESREGGWERYIHEDLGLTDADIVSLKASLLQ